MAPRVRFAPSPTGYLHIGGVRTALFNWLWARKNGGAFILRIEDTDQERSTQENKKVILDAMQWLGLDYDEGPFEQMQRLDIYREHVDKMVASGAAYRCYATKEELDAARDALKAQNPKAKFFYPGWWRDKGPDDWPSDKPYVIRLKTPHDGLTTYEDLVFGEQKIANNTMQDVVIVRNDGVPLYNLGCVVDDITMNITLVARGRDHMINTPIQVLIYKALGADVPQFAHLPLMLGKKREKLSKRHGAVSVAEYRKAGVPPMGLLNYLARFGWSYGDEEIFSRQELIEKFSWDRCGRADGKFDAQKLTAVAFEHLKREDLTSTAAYKDNLMPWLNERYSDVDETQLDAVLPQIRPRARTYREAADSVDWLFGELSYDEKAKNKFLLSDRHKTLPPLRALIADQEAFDAAAIETTVKAWAEREDIKLGAIAQPARVALTGKTVSPGIFEVMELLGKDTTIARLDAAIALAG